MNGRISHAGRDLNRPVFYISIAVLVAFSVFGAAATTGLGGLAEDANGWVAENLRWFYLLAANVVLVFVIGLMASRYGRIRLGPDGSRPEFSTISWFAMLFTTGLGVGAVFFAVIEPAIHALSAPGAVGAGKQEAAVEGMKDAMFHWGLHAWAIYMVAGLAIGYSCFRKGLPLRPASALHPLLGDRIYGWPGHLVDVLAVFATLTHLATSLGIGAVQINGGLAGTVGLPDNTAASAVTIVLLTGLGVLVVMLGINRGIRRLAHLNLWLAVLMIAMMFVAGPTRYLLNGLVTFPGHYLESLVGTSVTAFDAQTQPAAAGWQTQWTWYMWSGWFSWAPFVGMFFARISYGRTIRQCVAGGVLACTGLLVVWLTALGGSAVYYQLFGNTKLAEAAAEPGVVVLMERLPGGTSVAIVFSLLVIVVGALFSATSQNPGTMMADVITSGGDGRPVPARRFGWTASVGVIAAVLLIGGETAFEALQPVAIATALPFAIVLLLMGAALYKALRQDERPRPAPRPPAARAEVPADGEAGRAFAPAKV